MLNFWFSNSFAVKVVVFADIFLPRKFNFFFFFVRKYLFFFVVVCVVLLVAFLGREKIARKVELEMDGINGGNTGTVGREMEVV